MDPTQLARDVVSFMTPFFPFLVGLAKKASEEIGKLMGQEAWRTANSLWSLLKYKIQGPHISETLATATKQVSIDPQNHSAKVDLEQALADLFSRDVEFADRIESLLPQTLIGADLDVGNVLPTGEVLGAEIDSAQRAEVEVKIKAKEISGKITGVRVGPVSEEDSHGD